MTIFLVRRLFALAPVLLGVSTIVFAFLHLTPGDPAQLMLGDSATRESVALLRSELGLDRPLHVQYGVFLGNLVQGDLGRSITQRRPVIELIGIRLPATAELATVAILIALAIGISIGVLAALNQNTVIDYLASVLSVLGMSVPVFYLGLLLILGFGLNLGWFPVSGRGEPLWPSLLDLLTGRPAAFLDALRHIFLPALTLGLTFSALIARMTRATMLEVLQQDYVRTARAKGLGTRLVVFKHAFRNASIPLITVIGLQFSALLGGSILTETVFAWPGLGRLAVSAIFARDFPLVQGTVLTVAVVFVVINLLIDVTYGLIDPRVTYS